MKITTALIVATAALTVPNMAFANDIAENISDCKTEIRNQMPAAAENLDIDFNKVRGTSRLQTLSFRVELDGERDNLKCKVSRKKGLEIQWGDEIKPVSTQKVEMKKTTETVASGE